MAFRDEEERRRRGYVVPPSPGFRQQATGRVLDAQGKRRPPPVDERQNPSLFDNIGLLAQPTTFNGRSVRPPTQPGTNNLSFRQNAQPTPQGSVTAPQFPELMEADEYDSRLSVSGAIPTAGNRQRQIDAVGDFKARVMGQELRNRYVGGNPGNTVEPESFANEAGVLSQRQRNQHLSGLRGSVQEQTRRLDPALARSLIGAPSERLQQVLAEQSAKPDDLPANVSPFNTGRLPPGANLVGAGSGNLDPQSMYQRKLQAARDGQAVEFDNADAKAAGFRGSVMDSGAFRAEAQKLFAARGLNPDGTNPVSAADRSVMQSLRDRVKRGGPGSLSAADRLTAMQNDITERIKAQSGEGMKASDQIALARLNFDQQKFATTEARQKAEGQFKRITDYLGSQYEGEELARRTRLTAELGDQLNSLQDVVEADLYVSLLDKAGQDTGFLALFGDRGPVESMNDVQDIEFNDKDNSITIVDVDGKRHSTSGIEWIRDFSSKDRAKLKRIFNRRRGQ